MNDKISELIRAIKNKTENGLAEWEQSSSNTEFKLKLLKGKITTDYYRSESIDGSTNFIVEIRIYNERGDEIYSSWTTEGTDRILFLELKSFYDSVKSSYYKVSETIDALIKEAESPGMIGDFPPF